MKSVQFYSRDFVVTAELLEFYEACKETVDQFRFLFPNGTRLTRDACRKAGSANLDIDWFVDNLCADYDLEREYIRVSDEYYKTHYKKDSFRYNPTASKIFFELYRKYRSSNNGANHPDCSLAVPDSYETSTQKGNRLQ